MCQGGRHRLETRRMRPSTHAGIATRVTVASAIRCRSCRSGRNRHRQVAGRGGYGYLASPDPGECRNGSSRHARTNASSRPDGRLPIVARADEGHDSGVSSQGLSLDRSNRHPTRPAVPRMTAISTARSTKSHQSLCRAGNKRRAGIGARLGTASSGAECRHTTGNRRCLRDTCPAGGGVRSS